MNRLIFLWIVSLTVISPTVAAEETGDDAVSDGGFRMYASVGYPDLVGLGVGVKFESGTEILVGGGGGAMWGVLAGTGSVELHQQVARWPGGRVNVGWAGSIVHAYFPVIDCYGEGASCRDSRQNIWWTGPRISLRFRVDAERPIGGGTWVDAGAGPMIGACRGDCDFRSPLAMGVTLRVVMATGL